MKMGRKPEYPEKTPGDELQKMSHTEAQRFKPQARLELTLQHWWQTLVRKADVLTIIPHVSPTPCIARRIAHGGTEAQLSLLARHAASLL